jgi:hypothetical protein
MTSLNNENNKIKSISINLENLNIKYNNLLIRYKQALADYLSFIEEPQNKKENQFITVKGQTYWGTKPATNQSVNTNAINVGDCQALCSNTSGCSGATFNSSQYATPMCWLRSGESKTTIGLDSDYAIIPKGLQLLYTIENINKELNSVNKQIYDYITAEEPLYNNERISRQEKSKILMDNYEKLQIERENVREMINEYQTLEQKQGEQEIIINQNYFSFILLLLLVFIIIYVLYIVSGGLSNITLNSTNY